MQTFFIGLQILCIMLAIVALVVIINDRVTNLQQMMVCFLICIILQNAGYLLELLAKGAEAALYAVKIQYLGSCWIILFYCRFNFFYSGIGDRRKLFLGMALLNFLVMLFVWTSDYHNLFYREMNYITESDGFSHLSFTYGPVFYVFLVGCCLIPCILSCMVLLYGMKHEESRFRRRNYLRFVLLSLLPMVTLFLYACKVIKVYDPCPAILGLLLAGVSIFAWRKQDYDFSRTASDVLLSDLFDCILLLDQKKKIVSYNSTAAAIFGCTGEDGIGKNISELEGFPVDLIQPDNKMEFELHGGYFEGHCKAVYDRQNILRGYAVTIFDITSKQNYIEEIMVMRERAEAASHAKSEFLANMSHEIRTPMNAIVGMSEIIMEESRGRKVYEYARDIKASSKNLLNVINNVLDISNADVGRIKVESKEYNLADMINEMASISEMNARQTMLQFKLKMDEKLPCKYYGDEKRIRQVLQNLLDNAIKYTKKGTVMLSVSGQRAKNNQWNLEFCVEDTGIGIEEKDFERIFENFQQADSSQIRKVDGTGLGLSISRKLARLMHGDITVQSQPGKGSRFIFSLSQDAVDDITIDEMKNHTDDKKPKTEPMFTAKGCKILVVDDNMINRKVAVGMLKPYGCDVLCAENGYKAIEMVQQTMFDIIFMDHMMPEMDGVETTRQIRETCGENGTQPIIIALTANAMEGAKEKFLINGFQDFLAKPIDRLPLHNIMVKWI